MRFTPLIKRWLGVTSRHTQHIMNANAETTPHDKATTPASNLSDRIWLIHAAIDSVYGIGFAKDNPDIVAQFMRAAATQALATELGNIRQIIETGAGGITVGIERT